MQTSIISPNPSTHLPTHLSTYPTPRPSIYPPIQLKQPPVKPTIHLSVYSPTSQTIYPIIQLSKHLHTPQTSPSVYPPSQPIFLPTQLCTSLSAHLSCQPTIHTPTNQSICPHTHLSENQTRNLPHHHDPCSFIYLNRKLLLSLCLSHSSSSPFLTLIELWACLHERHIDFFLFSNSFIHTNERWEAITPPCWKMNLPAVFQCASVVLQSAEI